MRVCVVCGKETKVCILVDNKDKIFACSEHIPLVKFTEIKKTLLEINDSKSMVYQN